MKKILLLVVAAVLLTAPAFSQSDNKISGPNPALGSTPKAEEFVKEAAATDLFDIASAKLATQRGDDNIKAFAEKVDRRSQRDDQRAQRFGFERQGECRIAGGNDRPPKLADEAVAEPARCRVQGSPWFQGPRVSISPLSPSPVDSLKT
jgi:hypothetical protein